MDREYISKFANIIILLSKLFTKTEDRFLKQKLHEKISDLVFSFVKRESSDTAQHPTNVAQCGRPNLISSINNTIDYLEYLAHISKNDITPLLVTQKNLLKFKLFVLRGGVVQENPNKEIKTAKTPISSIEKIMTADVAISKPLTKKKSAGLSLRSDSNKERIFNFIKKTSDVRTKDVLNEFSALSGRTVKRNLRELTDEGFLKKRSDGLAVYYFLAE